MFHNDEIRLPDQKWPKIKMVKKWDVLFWVKTWDFQRNCSCDLIYEIRSKFKKNGWIVKKFTIIVEKYFLKNFGQKLELRSGRIGKTVVIVEKSHIKTFWKDDLLDLVFTLWKSDFLRTSLKFHIWVLHQ